MSHRCLLPNKLYELRSVYIRAATRGGAKGGGATLNKNFSPPKKLSLPTQTLLFLAAVLRWWLFLEINRKLGNEWNNLWRDDFFFRKSTQNSGKSRPSWHDDFFFGDQQRTLRKVDQPKNFGPHRNKFCPPKNNVLVVVLVYIECEATERTKI